MRSMNSDLLDPRKRPGRYERKGSYFLALLGLAVALTCYKKLVKPAT